MKIRYSILPFLLFCSSWLFAQDVKFTASASKTTVGTGEMFQVTFTLNGGGGNFSPPDFRGFQETGQSSQSVTDDNGSSSSIIYDLVPVKEGDFTIGPATLVANGHRYATSPIKIKVVKGRPVQQAPQAQGVPDETVSSNGKVDLSKSIFIKAIVDKSNVYQGQQIILNYRLYTKVNIVEMAADKAPDLNGFWGEDIKQKQQVREEIYKGQRYKVLDLKQTILYPERAGNLTIDPLEMTFVVEVPDQSNDMMAQFFGAAKQVKYPVKSAPVVIHVRPLPEAGKPDSFTGAVGDFSMEALVDKTELKANDALNYKVKVSGYGNIKLLKNLATNFPPDFEKYDPKINDSVTENENGVSGYRIYNYLLIPRHQGDYTIDPLKFSYFNAATNRYVTITSKGFHIKVDKGTSERNVTSFSGADKQDIKVLDKDIRYIKIADNSIGSGGGAFFGSFLYYLLLLIGPILCYAAFVYRNWMRKNNSDVVKVKSRQAGKVAARHLANAQKQLIANNTQGFYEDISKGIYGYLSDKLNIQYASLDKETIVEALKARSVSDQLTARLVETLDLCEMARYAPVTHISQKDVFEKAKGIINDIENEI
jgi:hypothetical protein